MKEQDKDISFIKAPARWPGLVLPVKRRTGGGVPDLGVIFEQDLTTVVFCNLWELSPEKIKGAAREKYSSVEDLVAAGWIVD